MTWERKEIHNWVFECFEIVLWLHLQGIITKACKQILYFPPAKDGEVTTGVNMTPLRIHWPELLNFVDMLIAIVSLRVVGICHVPSCFRCINKQDQLKALLYE